MTQRPTITLIMAVYNSAAYLNQSIESVVAQSYQDWELIIIDDGSTDESSTICDQWAERDSRLLVVHKENTGQADSRNLAISKAQGQWVMFIDSDDWIDIDMLQRMVTLQRQYQADMVVGAYYEEYINGHEHIHNQYVGTFTRAEAIDIYYHNKNKTTYVIWGSLLKSSLLQTKIPHLRYLEDTAVILQWMSGAQRVIITDDPFYHYRMRKGSVMHIDKKFDRAKTNLEVIRLRNQYAKSQQLLPPSVIDNFDAQGYLYVALQFVRGCWASSPRKQIAKTASCYISELTALDDSNMKRRIRKRLHLLIDSPVRFAWEMYINGLFSIHKYRSSKVPKNLFP